MDREAIQEFMGRFMEMVGGATTIGVIGVGDRTGLFAGMAGQGPLTLDEIVERVGLQERYARELLAALAASGVLEYRSEKATYELPEPVAACLADETSPYFMAGWAQMLPAILNAVPRVAEAAQKGGGVSYADFGPDVSEGIARSNAPGMRILLTRRWLRALPDVVERLGQGIRVADVGCGSGAASLAVGKAFPSSSVTGFDLDPTSVERARRSAADEGLSNVSFDEVAAEAMPVDPPFDFIMSFDTIHDMVNPRAALKRIREALHPDGVYLMVEPAAGDTLEENLHPGGALTYGMSTLHCLTVSLAHDGEGLGTAMGSRKAEELCREAGFTRFERLDIENPFNAFYDVRP